jgi:hypothetical protein
VWLYAGFCFLATVVHHTPFVPIESGQIVLIEHGRIVPIEPGQVVPSDPGQMVPSAPGLTVKPVSVFPHAWLGSSFLLVLCFVIIFSNVKTRGFLAAFVVAAAVALLLVFINYNVIRLPALVAVLNLVKIYMNEAYYSVFACVLLSLWLTVVFGIDHMTRYRFTAAQVVEEHPFGHNRALPMVGMVVVQHQPDIFRHQVLGLGFLLGTGDFICSVPGYDPLVIDNVVFLSRHLVSIKAMIAAAQNAPSGPQAKSA